MNTSTRTLTQVLVLGTLLIWPTAWGQDARKTHKDPFATPRAIEDASRTPVSPKGSRPVGVTLDVRVRGTLQVRGKKPAALLQCEGQTVVARAGETVAFPIGELKVLSVANGLVTVMWGEQRLTLR